MSDQQTPVQIAISIPKKRFKKATDRNLTRRRLRESYRTNKHELIKFLEYRNQQLHILVVYASNEVLEFKKIDQKIIELLNHLIQTISKS